MATPYEVLGIGPDADDEAIRRRFLELVNRYPPEQHPEKFSAVRAAYEKVKDLDARARFALFDLGAEDTIEAIIEDAACRTPRPRIGLTRLLTVTGRPGP